MQQLKSSDQLVYNGLEFNFIQVIAFTGSPQVKLDGSVFDVLGYQWWKTVRARPYTRVELIPGSGSVTAIVGDLDELAGISNVATPQVVGAAADGAAAAGNPVLVAGEDGAAAVRALPVNVNSQAARVATIGATHQNVTVGGVSADLASRAQSMDVAGRAKTVDRAADWGITNTSAAAGTATATKAASAGVRHLCKSLSASLGAGAAAQGPVNVVLRDGATGVGAIIHSGELAAPASSGDSYTPAEMNLIGTSGNAMTVEFTAAGAANTVQTVNAAGYDLSASD